jgi:hypothetical protein
MVLCLLSLRDPNAVDLVCVFVDLAHEHLITAEIDDGDRMTVSRRLGTV